jgi:hypothetical protein
MSSREVREASGEAPEKSLEERAAELRRLIEQPSPKDRATAELREIEAKIATQREDEAKAAAEKRIDGISRAAGGLVTTLAADEQKLLDAAKVYAEALGTVNARCRALEKLRAESAGLVDRFGVEPAKVAPVIEPEAREAVKAAANMAPSPVRLPAVRPSTEQCQYGLRERRDYLEIVGTPGYAVIESAGLKPFRALSPSEQRTVDNAVVDPGEQEMLKREAIVATSPHRTFDR